MSGISVIIPTRNRLGLLKETLSSIKRQTLRPDEIIIVDDHSTDGTLEDLKKMGWPDLILLMNEGNGPGAARNTGLKHAKGDLIQFFDSDDIMSANKLEVQAGVLRMYPQADVVYGPYVPAIEVNNKWIPTDVVMQFYPLPLRPFKNIVSEGWCAITQSCLFTKRLLDKTGPWREDLMTHEDLEYWYRISNWVSCPLHENQTLTIYRQHDYQITGNASNMIDRTLNGINVFREILNQTNEQKGSFRTKILLNGLIVNYEKFANKNGYRFYHTIKDNLVYFFYKLNSKAGRFRTGTNWQPVHGVNSDKEYLAIFNKNASVRATNQ